MKVLIPLDGSKFAEEVLEAVTRMVDLKTGVTEVHLIQVVDSAKVHATWRRSPVSSPQVGANWPAAGRLAMEAPSSTAPTAVETKDQALDRMHYESQEYLKGIAHRFFPKIGLTKVFFGEDPPEEIIRYARQEGVDLIAMATHGRTGLAYMLMGGVTSRVLNSRVAPVLLVRPDNLHQEH